MSEMTGRAWLHYVQMVAGRPSQQDHLVRWPPISPDGPGRPCGVGSTTSVDGARVTVPEGIPLPHWLEDPLRRCRSSAHLVAALGTRPSFVDEQRRYDGLPAPSIPTVSASPSTDLILSDRGPSNRYHGSHTTMSPRRSRTTKRCGGASSRDLSLVSKPETSVLRRSQVSTWESSCNAPGQAADAPPSVATAGKAAQRLPHQLLEFPIDSRPRSFTS